MLKIFLTFIALVGCEEKGVTAMHSYPILPAEQFFQPFSGFSPRLTASDLKSMPGLDKFGYMAMNTSGKIGSQAWRKRDYGDPNENDLSVSVAWHKSEAEAKSYYLRLSGRSLPIEKPFPGLEMPGCDEYSSRVLNIPGRSSLLHIVTRYGNYVFNVMVLTKSDGYFPDIDSFKGSAKAFDANVRNLLGNH